MVRLAESAELVYDCFLAIVLAKTIPHVSCVAFIICLFGVRGSGVNLGVVSKVQPSSSCSHDLGLFCSD